eukprot:202823-Hanusia_phi.AAC.1
MPTHDHKNGARADLWLSPRSHRREVPAEALRDSWLTLCSANLTLWGEINLDVLKARAQTK